MQKSMGTSSADVLLRSVGFSDVWAEVSRTKGVVGLGRNITPRRLKNTLLEFRANLRLWLLLFLFYDYLLWKFIDISEILVHKIFVLCFTFLKTLILEFCSGVSLRQYLNGVGTTQLSNLLHSVIV